MNGQIVPAPPPNLERGVAERTPTFDVVSIRPSETAGSFITTSDAYYALGRPLGLTILTAYVPLGLQSADLLVNAPDWVLSEKFDFIGKVGAEDLAVWSKRSENPSVFAPDKGLQAILQPMLQAALADRCKLVVHRIAAESPGFALVTANRQLNAAAMRESKPDGDVPSDALPISDGGRMVGIRRSDDPTLIFFHTSMTGLAAQLPFGRPIHLIDQTGLTGKYDFKLTRLNADEDIADNFDLAALGLKIVRVRVPVDKIVIDHIEKPVPN